MTRPIWFKADEMMPGKPGFYDCLVGSPTSVIPCTLWFDRLKWSFVSIYGMIEYDNVQHWRPFPSLPSGVKYHGDMALHKEPWRELGRAPAGFKKMAR